MLRSLCLRPAARPALARCRAYATATSIHDKVEIPTKPSSPVAPVVSTPTASTAPLSARRRATETQLIRRFKPRSAGLRHLRQPINEHLWKGKPYKRLTLPKKGMGKGGRNNTGRVTVRHRGGGHKRRIRTVDFDRTAPGKHTVDRIEYDPNRSAHIALITNNATQIKSYIVAPEGLRGGDSVESFRAGIPEELMRSMGGTMDPGIFAAKTTLRGNCMPIKLIPVGTQIHNIGSQSTRGAVFCRSAGTYGVVVGKEEDKHRVRQVTVKLQSGETRRVHPDACATIGVVSNSHYHFRQLGKAGRSRWLNIRPTVRGVAMNSVDHPLGGGRGKSKGNRIPVSPWGQQAKSGYKTRNKRNPNEWVVVPRPRNHGKRRTRK